MNDKKISDIFEDAGYEPSILFVPKNAGLRTYAFNALQKLNFDLNGHSNGYPEFTVDGKTIKLRRGEDIAQFMLDDMSQGHAVLGLTGEDLFSEFQLQNPTSDLSVVFRYDWDEPSARYLKPTLCLIGRVKNLDDLPARIKVAVKEKYRHTSERFLIETLGASREVDVTPYHGDLESAVASGARDCCVDVVYSGKTIDRYDLKVIEKIKPSDLVFVTATRTR